MIWFGSSAGVALANMYPEAKSAGRWLVGGWHVTVAYVIGFFVMLAVLGWHPMAAAQEKGRCHNSGRRRGNLAGALNSRLLWRGWGRFACTRGGGPHRRLNWADQLRSLCVGRI
jgi:hypothetical protein